MELDLIFRGDVVGHSEKGAKYLPKHKKRFIEREKSINELNIQLLNDEISDEDFLKKISNLFIHPKWFELIRDAVNKIDEQNPEENESNFEDIAAAIFLLPSTSKRNRTLSKKYFGKDWVNQF